MKRAAFLTMLLLVFTAVGLRAQTFMDRTHFEFMAGAGTESKGITPIDFSFKVHVEFVSISYLFVSAEDNVALYRHADIKSYYNGVSLGGGLGVKLLNGLESIHALDVRAKALSSVGSPDWKRTSYDLSLACISGRGDFRRLSNWATGISIRARRVSPIAAMPFSPSVSDTDGRCPVRPGFRTGVFTAPCGW